MDVVNVVMIYLEIISDTTNEFLLEIIKIFLIELKHFIVMDVVNVVMFCLVFSSDASFCE